MLGNFSVILKEKMFTEKSTRVPYLFIFFFHQIIRKLSKFCTKLLLPTQANKLLRSRSILKGAVFYKTRAEKISEARWNSKFSTSVDNKPLLRSAMMHIGIFLFSQWSVLPEQQIESSHGTHNRRVCVCVADWEIAFHCGQAQALITESKSLLSSR
jgi:hypothetical protein